MNKFIEITDDVRWSVRSGFFDTLSELIDEKISSTPDIPEILAEEVVNAWGGVGIILNELPIGVFQRFQSLISEIYDMMLAKWSDNPYANGASEFLYIVSVLDSLLIRDRRSYQHSQEPVSNQLNRDLNFEMPYWVCRFVWGNVIAVLHSKNSFELAGFMWQQVSSKNNGVDLSHAPNNNVAEIVACLETVKSLQEKYAHGHSILRQAEIDAYIDQLIAFLRRDDRLRKPND